MTYRLMGFKLEKTDPFPFSEMRRLLRPRLIRKVPQTGEPLDEALSLTIPLRPFAQPQQPGRMGECQTPDGIFATSHGP